MDSTGVVCVVLILWILPEEIGRAAARLVKAFKKESAASV
jgi:hypothetical protein